MNVEITKHTKTQSTDCRTVVTTDGIEYIQIRFEPGESFTKKEFIVKLIALVMENVVIKNVQS